MKNINPSRLFLASCMALVTTAMTFAIRAGLLGSWETQFGLTKEQVGTITSMAFYGFPVATVFGGLLVDKIGIRNLLIIAFVSHILGIVLTITASSYLLLAISTFFIGFANGSVEAACNPMVTGLYTENKTTMLNRFHVWFPGGIMIGAILATILIKMGIDWRGQVAIILIPTFIYGYLFWNEAFPVTERVASGVSLNGMVKAVFGSPLFYFLAFCMILTANTELSTGQWIGSLLGKVIAYPLLILALINGIMAVGRFTAGSVIHRLNPVGTLWVSSILATIGLYWLSAAQGFVVIPAAAVFAVGVCYFWPTLLGYLNEQLPESGALGLSLLGGIGMLATGMMQSVIGKWYDQNLATAQATTTDIDAANLIAGQSTLSTVAILPVILIVAFGILYFMTKGKTVVLK